MRVLLVAPAVLACVVPLALFACDDTPRGEQGVDYLDDGGYYSVPPGRDAGADVHVPCVEQTDTTGVCAQASYPAGTPATHLIVCTGGQAPADIVCDEIDAGGGDAGTFCCTTGVL